MQKISGKTTRREALRIGLAALSGSALMGSALVGTAEGAPQPDLWDRWLPSGDGLPGDGVDHTRWDQLLGRYRSVANDGVARFDYAKATADRKSLEDYIKDLEKVQTEKLSRPQQFAYWVNLYNAVTVRTILEAYPVKTIRDIGGGLFSSGPWGDKRIKIGGEELTLDDVEHRILRPIWKDPRIHFVVNCASIGCPDLPDRAMGATGAEAVLEQAARSYINHPRGVWVENRELTVSSIFIWYRIDFGDAEDKIINYLRRYASPNLAKALGNINEIDDDFYDWGLNEAKIG